MTKSEQKVFDVMVDFITKNKYPPTIRELCELTGYRAKSTIHYKLKSLEEQGLIETVPNGKRTIKIITPSEDYVPVVRCKDCKHKGWVQEPCHGKSIDWCKLHDICIKETDYCSYGERKNDNGKL